MSFRIHSKPVVIAPVILARPAAQVEPVKSVANVPNSNIKPIALTVPEASVEATSAPSSPRAPVPEVIPAKEETFKLRRKARQA